MANFELDQIEAERLSALVRDLVSEIGAARARVLAQQTSLVKGDLRAAKAALPDPEAFAAKVASQLGEATTFHNAVRFLAQLAQDFVKSPLLDDRIRQAFRSVQSAFEAGSRTRFERALAKLGQLCAEPGLPAVLLEYEAIAQISTGKPDRVREAVRRTARLEQGQSEAGISAGSPSNEGASSAPVGLPATVVEQVLELSDLLVAANAPEVAKLEEVIIAALPLGAGQLRAAESDVVTLGHGSVRGPEDSSVGPLGDSRLAVQAEAGNRLQEFLDQVLAPVFAAADEAERPPLPWPSELWATETGVLASAWAMVEQAPDLTSFLVSTQELTRTAESVAATVQEALRQESERVAAAQTRASALLCGMTLKEVSGRRTKLVDEYLALQPESETAQEALQRISANSSLRQTLDQVEAWLGEFRAKKEQEQARLLQIRALREQLALLEAGAREVPVAPSVPVTVRSSSTQETTGSIETLEPVASESESGTAGLRIHSAVRKPPQFPADGGLLTMLEDPKGPPADEFLPDAGSASGLAPLDAAANTWATAAVARIVQVLGASAAEGAASLHSSTRVFQDLALVLTGLADRAEARRIFGLVVSLLALSAATMPARRRSRLADTILQQSASEGLERASMDALRSAVGDAAFVTIACAAASQEMGKFLVDLAVEFAESGATAEAKSVAAALAVAIQVAPRKQADSAWQTAIAASGLSPAEVAKIDEYLDEVTSKIRPKALDCPGPLWMHELVARRAECLFESDSKGKANITVSVPDVVTNRGLYVAPGAAEFELPVLIRNSGSGAATGVEIRFACGQVGFEIPRESSLLQLAWLARGALEDANYTLATVLVRWQQQGPADTMPTTLQVKYTVAAPGTAQTSKTFSCRLTDAKIAPKEMGIPHEGILGRPLDLSTSVVLERSSSSVKACLQDIRRALVAGNPVKAMVYGRRRRGKSSICRTLERDVQVRHHFVVEQTLWNSARITDPRDVVLQIGRMIERALQQRNISVESFRGAVGDDPQSIFGAWCDWLSKVETTLTAPVNVLLLVDEFQRWVAGLERKADRQVVLNLLRHFNDMGAHSKLQVAFVLFGLRNLERIRRESTDFAAAVSAYEIKPFTLQESAKYVSACLPLELDQRVRRRLHHLSGGNPLIINRLCDVLWRRAKEAGRVYCLPAHVEELADVETQGDSQIEAVFRYMLHEDEEEGTATLPQLTTLRAAAALLHESHNYAGSITADEVEAWLRRKGVDCDIGLPAEQLAELVDVGVLEVASTSARFSLPGEAMCRWLAGGADDPRNLPAVTRARNVDLVLRRYRQLHQLGIGGQASTWLAENIEDGGAKVVLKIYSGQGDAIEQRVALERAMLSRIKSRYVVTCHGSNVDPAKGGIVILEWVDGVTLRKLLDEKPAAASNILAGGDLPDTVQLFSKLAQGVAAIHAAKVVHKDLKPENIMMAEEHGVWEPKIIDLGIAGDAAGTDSGQVTLMLGTDRYLPPEKRDNPQLRRTFASDIFSLGAVFVDLLSGEPIDAMPEVAWASLRAKGTEKLAGLVDEMLSSDPQTRPSAEQVRARLDGALEPQTWQEYRDAGYQAYLAEQYDEAIESFRMAVATATKADHANVTFAEAVHDLVSAIQETRSDFAGWSMLFEAAIDARSAMRGETWPLLVTCCAQGRSRTTGSSNLETLLDVLERDGSTDTQLIPLVTALVQAPMPSSAVQLKTLDMLRRFMGSNALPAVVLADFCAKMALQAMQASEPVFQVEEWIRRGRRAVPRMTDALQAVQRDVTRLRGVTQSALQLPAEVVEADRDYKVVGNDEQGHTNVERLERFGGRLMQRYSFIQSVKRVNRDGGIAAPAPTLLGLDNLASHLRDGMDPNRIIPIVLDGSYSASGVPIRLNAVLPKGVTAPQQRVAWEVLAKDRDIFEIVDP